MKHYFLGMASGYRGGKWLSHLFTVGRKRDYGELTRFLGEKYGGEAILCKNGRSALALALKAVFKPGDAVIVNGFTCYAVYEAVRAAGLKPVFVDISKEDFNFDYDSLVGILSGPAAVSSNANLAASRSASLAPVDRRSPAGRRLGTERKRSVRSAPTAVVTGLARYLAPVVANGLEVNYTSDILL